MAIDRKSTRLNSSHLVISYAVFCLKKKKQKKKPIHTTRDRQPPLSVRHLHSPAVSVVRWRCRSVAHGVLCSRLCFFFFFFNDTATTEIYTLSLHDALPISSFTCATSGVYFWRLPVQS